MGRGRWVHLLPWKLYVPNVKELRREVVKQCHDSVTAGHPSKNRTIELVSRYYCVAMNDWLHIVLRRRMRQMPMLQKGHPS
jgi:hypothetical protein